MTVAIIHRGLGPHSTPGYVQILAQYYRESYNTLSWKEPTRIIKVCTEQPQESQPVSEEQPLEEQFASEAPNTVLDTE